jgi:hypothetical protein
MMEVMMQVPVLHVFTYSEYFVLVCLVLASHAGFCVQLAIVFFGVVINPLSIHRFGGSCGSCKEVHPWCIFFLCQVQNNEVLTIMLNLSNKRINENILAYYLGNSKLGIVYTEVIEINQIILIPTLITCF